MELLLNNFRTQTPTRHICSATAASPNIENTSTSTNYMVLVSSSPSLSLVSEKKNSLSESEATSTFKKNSKSRRSLQTVTNKMVKVADRFDVEMVASQNEAKEAPHHHVKTNGNFSFGYGRKYTLKT